MDSYLLISLKNVINLQNWKILSPNLSIKGHSSCIIDKIILANEIENCTWVFNDLIVQ